ncbi:MAG TPA: AIPR family protein, partial [Terriglobales bacterium]|nr:AIPR family protein [Terriglobales bacterium]
NVRLSLTNTKEARDRLVHPMVNTLNMITTGKLSPSIFPFYHTGVTIAASSLVADGVDLLNLEAPSIINGCQTQGNRILN